MADQHQFLSDEWLAAAKAIAEEHGGGAVPSGVTLNVVVTGGPQGDRELHFADGNSPPASSTMPRPSSPSPTPWLAPCSWRATSRPPCTAFMGGQIKVEGDMTKLMAMQSQGGGGGDQAAAQAALQSITADDLSFGSSAPAGTARNLHGARPRGPGTVAQDAGSTSWRSRSIFTTSPSTTEGGRGAISKSVRRISPSASKPAWRRPSPGTPRRRRAPGPATPAG